MSLEILDSAINILHRLGILDHLILEGEPADKLYGNELDFKGIFKEIPFLIERPHTLPKADIHEAFRAEGFDYLEDCYGRLSTFHRDETRIAFYSGLTGSSKTKVIEIKSLGINIMGAKKYNSAFESTSEVSFEGHRIRVAVSKL